MTHHHHRARPLPRFAFPAPRLVVPKLLAWFAANARDLPWRRTRDPYAIWVSEIMLQQTQVKTVIPYWERWMQQLPTLAALANARPERIHKLWEGLGYYTRVRNMQKAAQFILAKHGGNFPVAFADILALPGIGRYTAGAIASIAFNQPAPILDGNVIRVLTRLHGIGEDPRDKKTNARLWQLAEELVAHASRTLRNSKSETRNPKRETPLHCSALNQSLMELGALICSPRSPNCAACPVAAHCTARRDNRVEEIPRPKQRAAVTARRFAVFVVERNGTFLVQQRGANVVNAHLWEFPNVEIGVTEDRSRHSVRALFRSFADGAQGTDAPCRTTDFQFASAKPFCVVKHSITRYRMTAEAYQVKVRKTPRTGGAWQTLAQLQELPFTAAHRRIAARLADSQPATQ